jgi:hypothetical protein
MVGKASKRCGPVKPPWGGLDSYHAIGHLEGTVLLQWSRSGPSNLVEVSLEKGELGVARIAVGVEAGNAPPRVEVRVAAAAV